MCLEKKKLFVLRNLASKWIIIRCFFFQQCRTSRFEDASSKWYYILIKAYRSPNCHILFAVYNNSLSVFAAGQSGVRISNSIQVRCYSHRRPKQLTSMLVREVGERAPNNTHFSHREPAPWYWVETFPTSLFARPIQNVFDVVFPFDIIQRQDKHTYIYTYK